MRMDGNEEREKRQGFEIRRKREVLISKEAVINTLIMTEMPMYSILTLLMFLVAIIVNSCKYEGVLLILGFVV